LVLELVAVPKFVSRLKRVVAGIRFYRNPRYIIKQDDIVTELFAKQSYDTVLIGSDEDTPVFRGGANPSLIEDGSHRGHVLVATGNAFIRLLDSVAGVFDMCSNDEPPI
jgi:hypothetical protein